MSKEKFIAGLYTAKSKGHSSEVQVTAEFDNSSIKKVTVDSSGETPSIGGKAGEILSSNILKAQSPEFDAVSGASETSSAVERAFDKIYASATGQKSAEKLPVKNGTYTASSPSFSPIGPMTGEVTFKNNKITDIRITKESDSATSQWFDVAKSKLIPRLIKSQSLDTDAVTGASTSSGAIKSIVAKTIDEAGGKSSQWYTPLSKKTDTVKLDGYDVIVVGLGGSGILSYCAAAKSGAKVYGIEASGAIGGNSISTCGPMVVNSKNLDAKYNNGENNIDENDLYKTWINYVDSDKKSDLIKVAIDKDGEALDYYMDNFDFSFDGAGFGGPSGFIGSFVRPDWNKEWIMYTADNNNTKWYATGPDHTFQFKYALEKAKSMNDKNDYQLELSAEKLLTDDSGKITGVHAISYDGTQYDIYAKAVILASGGFLGNDEMMKEVYGSSCRAIGDLVNKGTGIKMGQSVGGATYALNVLPMIHISQVANIIRDDSLTADQKAILSAIATTGDAKQIDENGNILGSEDESGTTNDELTVGIAYAPGFHYFNAYTEGDINHFQTNGLSAKTAAINIFGLNQGGKMPEANTPIRDIHKIVDEAIKHGDAFRGTPKELAHKLGMDEKALTKSLGDANSVYYLFEDAAYAYATCGGLDIDTSMRVLKEDGTPIANLFAVGQDSEGVGNKDGEAYTPWGGQAQAWTFVSGKIAGENAAALK